MACNITAGRALDCKDAIGGIKNIYVSTGGQIDTDNYTEASSLITQIMLTTTGAAWQVYKFELPKGVSSYTETLTSSPENGTVFFAQSLAITLHKLEKTTAKQLKTLATDRPQIIIEDNNGNLLLIGKIGGCDVATGTMVTGAAFGDMNGYTLEITGMEKEPAVFCTAGTSTTSVEYPLDNIAVIDASSASQNTTITT